MRIIPGRLCALLGMLLIAGEASVRAAESPSTAADLAAQLAAMRPAAVGWNRVDELVVRALLEADRRLVENNLAQASATLPVLLARLDLALRAGHDTTTRETLKRLCKRRDFRTSDAARAVAAVLLERKKWGLAILVLSECPGVGPGIGQHIVNYVAKTQGDGAADKLLQKLAAAGGDEWVGERVWFRAQRHGADGIFRKLEAAVRAEPASLARAKTYLHAVKREGKHRDVNWMGKLCRPVHAFDSYLLGRDLLKEKAYSAAIALLRRSLATRVTQEDGRRISMWTQASIPEPESALRMWTQSSLAQAYDAIGRRDLAKALRDKMLAHRTRSAAGPMAAQQQRGQVAGAETLAALAALDTASWEYWLARAENCASRKEDAEARAAFGKALSLAPACSPDTRSRGGSQRYRVLTSYMQYLRSRQQWTAVEQLLRSELEHAPPGCDTRQYALSTLDYLAGEGHATIRHDDELLWTTFALHERWDSAEERLLDRMLRFRTPVEKDIIISRAEKLCSNADPSRAVVLGALCTRWEADDRAVVLLQDTIARPTSAERKYERERAERALFEAYLHLGHPDEAEGQFWDVASRLDAEEIISRMTRIAGVAAEVGDADRAMRLWRKVANVDAICVDDPRALADMGVREDLRRFYHEWQRTDPESWVPAAALKRIDEPPIRGIPARKPTVVKPLPAPTQTPSGPESSGAARLGSRSSTPLYTRQPLCYSIRVRGIVGVF